MCRDSWESCYLKKATTVDGAVEEFKCVAILNLYLVLYLPTHPSNFDFFFSEDYASFIAQYMDFFG